MSKSSASPTLAPIPADDSAAYVGPPQIFVCSQCKTRIAHTARIVSTAYRGHSGKAVLLSETRNVKLDPPSILLMDSGAYTIQEFICQTCEAYLGWRFTRAHDSPERWKEGHFVLEQDLVDACPDDGALALALAIPSPASSSSSSTSSPAYLAYPHPHPHPHPHQYPHQYHQQFQQQGLPLHKRAMSAGVVAHGAKAPPGARQGVRSLQASPRAPAAPPPAALQRRPGAEDFEDGPFWTPR